MKEVRRLKKIVAVRTTQRDISAMRLLAAKQELSQIEIQGQAIAQRLLEASCKNRGGVQTSPAEMERMDFARTAAREEMAAWQESKQEAVRKQESARERVKAQHTLLRQSELMQERAKEAALSRRDAAEQTLADEHASREHRGP